jgi:CRISPR/Cas system type I-B associated protein Csh2 (Cas7 group RAMP superfamily)
LDANPECKVRLGAEQKNAVASRLTDSEKATLWHQIERTIPQMKSYKVRTSRNIKVYRLRTQ